MTIFDYCSDIHLKVDIQLQSGCKWIYDQFKLVICVRDYKIRDLHIRYVIYIELVPRPQGPAVTS